MSPDGNPIGQSWDQPQENGSFSGAGQMNDIPPEYANDPEMWQAIKMSLMDSNAQNPDQTDQTAFEALDLTNQRNDISDNVGDVLDAVTGRVDACDDLLTG